MPTKKYEYSDSIVQDEISKDGCCPKCSTPLRIAASGNIGFCPAHDKYFPLSVEKAAFVEAAQQNVAYVERKKQDENKRREEERQKRADAVRIKRANATKKSIGVMLLLIVAAVAVVWFIVIPNEKYKEAEALLQTGEYSTALERFASLGTYKNSDDNALLCEAMLDLQENDIASAMQRLNALELTDNGALADTLRVSILPTIANWREHGISAQAMLSLLKDIDTLDPKGQLDKNALSIEAHAALLDSSAVLNWYMDDLNGDQIEEMIALNNDFSISAYNITGDKNEKIILDRSVSTECLIAFGDEYLGENAQLSLKCYHAAYALRQDALTRQKLAEAYQVRAVAYETRGDYAAAIADAESAFDVLNTKASFQFCFGLTLRYCQSLTDMEQSIAFWDSFAANNAASMLQFESSDAWRVEAAKLRSAYAIELASWKDSKCPQWLRAAWAYGADIQETLLSAIERFDIGKTRFVLREIALELYADVPEKLIIQKALLTEEIGNALSDWMKTNLEADEVFALIQQAEALQLDLDGIDVNTAYREAALSVTANEQLIMYQFVDFDSNAKEEILGLNTQGDLVYYALRDTFQCVNRWQEGFSNPSLERMETSTVLLEADDGVAVFAYKEGELKRIFCASDIYHYSRTNTAFTYDILLDGSIIRYAHYAYDLSQLSSAATLEDIQWQANDYPLPQTASEAITRYFEAIGYGIAEEAERLLSSQPFVGLNFDAEALAALNVPDMPLSLSALTYYTEKDMALCEVRYTSKGQTIQTYIGVSHTDGWTLVGAGNCYTGLAAQDAWNGDVSTTLLGLNTTTSNTLANKAAVHTYRVLLPFSARVQLSWQAGEKKGNSNAFVVCLYRGAATENAYISYAMQLSEQTQKASELFLPAGIYSLTVSAANGYKDCEYSVYLSAEPNAWIETENNDSISSTNNVQVNQQYHASLQTANDVDLFAFTLEQAGAVSVSVAADNSGSKESRYVISMADGVSNLLLERCEMAGTDETCRTNTVYLAAGKHLLQFAAGKAGYFGEYRFTIHYEQMTNAEAERNDTIATATPIALDTAVFASSGVSGDVDCFVFTLPEDGLTRVSMAFNATKSTRDTYIMTVYNGDRVIWSGKAAGTDGAINSCELALPIGTYTVRVENPIWNHDAYKIKVSHVPVALEKENNNALSSAMPIKVNEDVYGTLLNVSSAQTGSDIDNYKFSIDQPGRVRLSFGWDGQNDRNSYYALALADMNINALYTVGVSGRESELISDGVYLDAGEYIVQVVNGRNTWQGAYRLCVLYEENASCELEYNNTASSASELPLGTQIIGSFALSDDIDLYRFTLPSGGIVQPGFSFSPLDNNQKTYTMTLTDGENAIHTINFTGKESNKAITPTILTAGTYYVQIENPVHTSQDYVLSISFSPLDGAEREPNNELANATLLLLDQPLTGLLSTKSDVDFYELTVADEIVVVLRLTFNPIVSSDANYLLQLEQNGKVLWKTRVPAKNGGCEQKLQIPAGTYYLRINSETWLPGLYTIEAE